MRLDNKVAFITGAGMGVGRATCLLFADEGAKIVAADINRDAGKETVRLIKERGEAAEFVQCDVAHEQSVKQAIGRGVKAFGRLDILYNNAGVLWRDKDVEVTRTDESTWDKVMAINLKGTVWVCKYGIPELIKQCGGAIVNIGSGTALMGFTTAQDAYTASKGALTSLTRSLAVVYAKDKIRANIIHPGGVMWVSTFTSRFQVSGVRFHQLNSAGCVGIAHEMGFLSQVLAVSSNQFMVQDSLFTDTRHLTPETISGLIYGRVEHL